MLELVAKRKLSAGGKTFQPGDIVDVAMTERELSKFLKVKRVGIRNSASSPTKDSPPATKAPKTKTPVRRERLSSE